MKRIFFLAVICLVLPISSHAQTAPQPALPDPSLVFFSLIKAIFPLGNSSTTTPNAAINENKTGAPEQTEAESKLGTTASFSKNPRVPFFCQGDARWRDVCFMGGAGCGPTSLAMAVSAFGTNINPAEIDKMFRAKGYRNCTDEGSYMVTALTGGLLPSMGFSVSVDLVRNQILNLAQAKKLLDTGYIIVASSHKFPCVNCSRAQLISHIFVVDSVDEKNSSVSIRDPNNCSYGTGSGHQEIESNRIRHVSAFPWLYAYGIKKN